MASLKDQIISQASIIIGNGRFSEGSSARVDRTRDVSEVFIDSIMEDVFLAVRWNFAISRWNNSENLSSPLAFKETGITDCLKVVSIIDGICEWYITNERLYFKGNNLRQVFYYSGNKLRQIIDSDNTKGRGSKLPFSYINVCGIALASEIAHSIYGDSALTEGLKAQYLRKLNEMKQIHQFDCNIDNAGNF
jgi:hypothetical protein